MKIEDMIIEPFALDEEHLELFLLPFVQPLFNDLALICSENLILTLGGSSEQSGFYRRLLVFRTD